MPRVLSDDGLTFKEREFAKEFSRSLNATESARRAYDCGNDHSANVLGSKVLKRLVKVGKNQGIGSVGEVLLERLTPEWILGNLVRLAEGSRRDADKIRALELLGKYGELSLWRDYQVQEVVKSTEMTEEEIDNEYRTFIEAGNETKGALNP